jgi:uncharacterized protein (TIGR02246 family)
MSRILPTVTALLLAATAAACDDEPLTVRSAGGMAPQANVSGGPRDHEAIQRIVDTFDLAWTAGDWATYAAQYAGAEFVGPTGVVLTDPAAIAGLYRNIFTGPFAGSTRSSTIRNLTFLTGTIAVLDIDSRGTGFAFLPPGVVPWKPDTTRALEKNILEKRAGAWRIIKHQQTIVAPGVM